MKRVGYKIKIIVNKTKGVKNGLLENGALTSVCIFKITNGQKCTPNLPTFIIFNVAKLF
jgi:hypothetical protein